MGVSGVGKTTVGELLAEKLGWTFLEGDDFHPPENVAKMHAGIPLDDADRAPWLAAIRDRLRELNAQGRSAVLACSALKRSYRQVLRDGTGELRVVDLDAGPQTIAERLAARRGHFMNPDLLPSQFQTLEVPRTGLRLDAAEPPAELVRRIREGLGV